MKFLFYVLMWRWYELRGKDARRRAADAQEMAVLYRDRAYADATEHAERVEMMRRWPR